MGFYKTGQMAIHLRSCLLIVLFFSLMVLLVFCRKLIKQDDCAVDAKTSFSNQVININMGFWVRKSKHFYLQILRFRPHPAGGYEIWFNGQYLDFLRFMRFLHHSYPQLSYRRVMLRQQNDALLIQMEVSR